MQTKDFTIRLDMQQPLPFHPFEVVEGDTGNVLHVALQNNGLAMDLTDCDVCITFASSMGFAIQDTTSGVTVNAADGELTILLYPTSYGAGNVSADIQVYSGSDNATLITSTRFDFRCRRSLISEEIIRANTAYPPLVAATAEATAATAAALQAVAAIDTSIGELNVQSDWTETDAASDAYILHKPSIPAVPADVGAAAADHTHTPASIGAAAVHRFTAAFPATGWSDTAPYTQTVAVIGMDASMQPKCDILFGDDDTLEQKLAQKEAWLCVDDVDSGAGSLTLTCFETPPETAFGIQMEVTL